MPRLQRQLQAIRRELENTVSPPLAAELRRILPPRDEAPSAGAFPPYKWAFGAVAAGPVEAFEFDARAVRARCAADPVLGYEVTHRVAHVLSKRLQSARGRLITASIQPAGMP